MSQTRMQSLIEAWTNIAVGLAISMLSNFLIFPLFGWKIGWHQNLVLGVWMTAISLVRSYTLRRFFNRIHRPRDRSPMPSCDYQGHEFGARYPDSVCLEGYLWDADSGWGNGDGTWTYTNGGEIPCPKCNRSTYRDYIRGSFFDDAYDRLGKGQALFRKAKPGFVLMCFREQLHAWVLFRWDERPSWMRR